jgi:hypothetical protein
MVVLRPDPVELTDERAKDFMFKLITHQGKVQDRFAFEDALRLWFNGDVRCLAAFLEWLDEHELQIRGKK